MRIKILVEIQTVAKCKAYMMMMTGWSINSTPLTNYK